MLFLLTLFFHTCAFTTILQGSEDRLFVFKKDTKTNTTHLLLEKRDYELGLPTARTLYDKTDIMQDDNFAILGKLSHSQHQVILAHPDYTTVSPHTHCEWINVSHIKLKLFTGESNSEIVIVSPG